MMYISASHGFAKSYISTYVAMSSSDKIPSEESILAKTDLDTCGDLSTTTSSLENLYFRKDNRISI
ncbi:hypothetical protein MT325_m426L [Paramecium bursaria chlorella virus MT325]|uniref:Uncharacterized protein m426L n=1 Tax=Paramecium bursaria Chlorella virus MT325 TaxID=346932 RepID=A7IUF6_PBCVM|nr:hypothetical protein MT325_m426L [Paramecium bursaria chlorella virus MT325]